PVSEMPACVNETLIGPLSPEPVGGLWLAKLPVHDPVRFGLACAEAKDETTIRATHHINHRWSPTRPTTALFDFTRISFDRACPTCVIRDPFLDKLPHAEAVRLTVPAAKTGLQEVRR